MRNDALIFIRKCAHRQSPHAAVTSPNAVSGNGKQKIKQKIPWKVLRQTNKIRPRNTNENSPFFRSIETAQNGIVRGCRSNASLVGLNGINQNCHQVLTSPIVTGPKSYSSDNEVSNIPVCELNTTAKREQPQNPKV